jgi:trigger factor
LEATVSEPQSWKKTIAVEIPFEEVQTGFDKKLHTYKKDMKLPGFRPGKVPQKLIQNRFGPAIKAEVIDELISKAFKEACSNNGILPVSEPKVSDLKAEDGQPVSFTIEVEVDPKIEITGYKKLKVKPSPKKIKDSDVDTTIEDLRDRLAEFKDIDRESRKGDHISIEYVTVQVNGEEKKDLPAPKYPIEIGKSSLKEFDKGLLGLKTGDQTQLTVKYPKDYHAEDLAGKTADLTINVTGLKEKIIPELNEAFLKKLGDYADETALREAIRKDLEAQEQQRAREEAHSKAIETLIDHNKFEVPPSRVEYYLDKVMEEQARYYPAGKGPTREEIGARYRDVGIAMIKKFRIIDYIARQEKIKATQEEVDKKIEAIAAQYNQPFDSVKAALRKQGTTSSIREDIREQKTLDALIGEFPWPEEGSQE